MRSLLLILSLLSLAVASDATAAATAGKRVRLEGTLLVTHQDNPELYRYYLVTSKNEHIEMKFKKKVRPMLSGAKIRATGVQSGQVMMLDSMDSTTDGVQVLMDAPPPDTLGEQKTLVVLVNFQDAPWQKTWSVEEVREFVFGTVSNAFKEYSYGQTWLTGDVVGWVTLAQNTGNAQWPLADAQLRKMGVDLTKYKRFVYLSPHYQGNCGGVASIGGSKSWTLVGCLGKHVWLHEMGHNLGLYHAHSLNCTDGVLGGTCTSTEYGDWLSDVGGANNGEEEGHGHYSAIEKLYLGWLQNGSGVTTVSGSGTYNLGVLETLTVDTKSLRIPKSVDPVTGKTTYYYVEYRRALGFDAYLNRDDLRAPLGGVIVRIATEGNPDSNYLLDMTPNSQPDAAASYTAKLDQRDGALALGTSYQDAIAGITISVLSLSETGASIKVQIGGTPTDLTAPAAPQALIPAAGTIVDQMLLPTFSWSEVADASGVTYQLQAWVYASSFLINTTTKNTAFLPTEKLPQGTQYWRVRAIDGAGNIGPWSTTLSFSKPYSTSAAPAAPIPMSPLSGANVGDDITPQLTWSAVPEVLAGAGGGAYRIQVATDAAFTSILRDDQFPAFMKPRYTYINQMLTPGTYYWRVAAKPYYGFSSSWTPAQSFVVSSQAPPAPSLVAPLNGAVSTLASPFFDWTDVTDESGIDHYQIWVDDSADFSSPTKMLALTSSYSYSVYDGGWRWITTLANGTYYWRVRAVDAYGSVGEWSTPQSFIQSVDALPPTVSFLSPANAATVTGIIPLSASASDDVGVKQVEFYVDGVLKGMATSAPYTLALDTSTLRSGSRVLMAKAIDVSGNSSSAQITINILDKTPPTVVLTNPVDGAVYSPRTTLTLTASATDDLKVARVEFYVNNVLVNTDTAYSYSYAYKLPSTRGATYVIRAQAYDSAGNTSSHQLTIKSSGSSTTTKSVK